MKNNEELQKDVQEAIKWEPLLKAAEIGVIAENGVITLTGTVDCYPKKIGAESAAKNVSGVKAVVEKIDIKFNGIGKKTDKEIADEVLHAFKWHWQIPSEQIEIKVENGWVYLQGKVHWNYQREAVTKAIRNLRGLKGVSNEICIQSEVEDKVEKYSIERALSRSASVDGKGIHVIVTGNSVILTGTVYSLVQKGEAARIAWSAPGVVSVNNELAIRYKNKLSDLIE